jgi:hypothetical protein
MCSFSLQPNIGIHTNTYQYRANLKIMVQPYNGTLQNYKKKRERE